MRRESKHRDHPEMLQHFASFVWYSGEGREYARASISEVHLGQETTTQKDEALTRMASLATNLGHLGWRGGQLLCAQK